MKINLLKIIFIALLGLPAFAQSTWTIKLNSPPESAQRCVTRFTDINTATSKTSFYEILVPLAQRPEIAGGNFKAYQEGDNIVFSFALTGNSSCESASSGFTIRMDGQNSGEAQNQVAAPAAPEPTPNPDAEKSAAKGAFDFSVPESPGFTILGLNPQEVVRPATPRQFATTLLSSVDANGNLQNGIAVDAAPYLVFWGDKATLAKYKTDYFTRFLSRAQFSLATTKGTSDDDKSARIGAGIHLTLFDHGDPRMDEKLGACFRKVVGDLRSQVRREFGLAENQGPSEANLDRYNERYRELIEGVTKASYQKCIDASRARNFAKSSFVIGGAASWISENGDSNKFARNGEGVWASLSYGFRLLPNIGKKENDEDEQAEDKAESANNAQLILHFRRRVRESVPDPLDPDKFTTVDSNLFGARLRFGNPNWTGNIEGVYKGEHFAGKAPDNKFILSAGADYRISDNVYLNFSVGGETKKSSVSDNKVFVRTSFNWGVSKEPKN